MQCDAVMALGLDISCTDNQKQSDTDNNAPRSNTILEQHP